MPPKRKLRVIKVPLDYEVADIPAKFPPMPILYLELLENKQKIKPELRNKEYVPKVMKALSHRDKGGIDKPLVKEEEFDIQFEDDGKKDKVSEVKTTSLIDSLSASLFGKKKPVITPLKSPSSQTRDLKDFTHFSDKRDKDYKAELKYQDSTAREKERKDASRRRREFEDRRKEERDKRRSKRETPRSKRSHHKSRREHKHRSLTKEKVPERKDENKDREQKNDTTRKVDEKQPGSVPSTTFDPHMPPKLSDIANGNIDPGHKGVRDMNARITSEDEVRAKRELLFRFDILRRSYKGASIPEYSEYSDLETMKRAYDDTVRRVSLDATVENYKKYLGYGFMGVEYVLGSSWFKLDMSGFAQQQIINMNSYDRLLIELGEKSYLDQESSWPVEIRLIIMIVVNTAFFLVTKMVLKATGTNFGSMMNQSSVNQAPEAVKPKKKMKGPDLSDL
jgi:hypothetical protein